MGGKGISRLLTLFLYRRGRKGRKSRGGSVVKLGGKREGGERSIFSLLVFQKKGGGSGDLRGGEGGRPIFLSWD